MDINRRAFIQLTAAGALMPQSLLAAIADSKNIGYENSTINGWRFREIDVSNLRIFGEGEPIQFGDGVTFIEGMNGGGKTTIYNALRGRFPGVDPVVAGKRDMGIPDWLTFVDESMQFDPWHPSRSLALLFRRREFAGRLDLLSREIESSFNELVRYKRKPPIRIKIPDDDLGVINISGYALPAGEKMALQLATIQAIRKVGGTAFGVPLVLDSAFDMFDMALMEQVPGFLESTASQVIVIGNPLSLSCIRCDLPDYRIRRDKVSQKHYVANW